MELTAPLTASADSAAPLVSDLAMSPITPAKRQALALVDSEAAPVEQGTSVFRPEVIDEFAEARQAKRSLDGVVSYLPWMWLVGSPLTFALLAAGLVGSHRLLRDGQLLKSGPLVDTCEIR